MSLKKIFGRGEPSGEYSDLDMPYIRGPMTSKTEAPPSPYGPSPSDKSVDSEVSDDAGLPSIRGPMTSKREAPPSPYES